MEKYWDGSNTARQLYGIYKKQPLCHTNNTFLLQQETKSNSKHNQEVLLDKHIMEWALYIQILEMGEGGNTFCDFL